MTEPLANAVPAVRGDLRFLQQARRQLPRSHVHDGWRYFLHGWTLVIAEVFDIELTEERFVVLQQAAELFRPPAQSS